MHSLHTFVCSVHLSSLLTSYSLVLYLLLLFIHSSVSLFFRSFVCLVVDSFVVLFVGSSSFVHSFIHFVFFTESFVGSLVRWLVRSFGSFIQILLLNHSLIRCLVRSFAPSFIHPFLYWLVCWFVLSFVHSSILFLSDSLLRFFFFCVRSLVHVLFTMFCFDVFVDSSMT